MLMAVGCTDDEPRPVESTKLDQGIRTFDFRNAVWFEYPDLESHEDGGEVPLRNGEYQRGGSDPFRLGYGPVFADADHDGDEDAVLALELGGQGVRLSWYLWVWQDDTAEQVRYPFLRYSRCDYAATEVRPVADGFEVQTAVPKPERVCAEGATIPVSYIIGVKDSYPVRLRPEKGAPQTCDRPGTVPARVNMPLSPRVAPEAAAPVIGTPRRYDEVTYLPHYRETSASGVWYLGMFVAGQEKICGWARGTDMNITQE